MLETLILEVIGGLIAAGIIAAGGYFAGRFFQQQRYRKAQAAAIASFSDNLERVIVQGSANVAQARVIVSIRDASRGELTSLNRLLNSDIDILSGLLQEADGYQRENRPIPENLRAQIRERILVLQGTWPAKKTQIDVAIRRVMAELGLTPIV
jgi:hypothetical protein